MTDSFDIWIESMSDEEYEDRLDSSTANGGFSVAQEAKALNIRKPASEEDLEDLEREQESNVVEVKGRTSRVYDNRELPERPRYILTPSGDALVLPEKQLSPSEQRIQQVSNVQQSREIQKQSFLTRIKNFILRRK